MTLLALTLIAPFQNCSHPGDSVQFSRAKGGTGGVDGKLYASYDLCPDNKIGVMSAITVAKDGQSAAFLRQDCQDLRQPVPIAVAELKFAIDDPSVFQLNGKVFDQQIGGAGQKVTLELCSSPSVQAAIWQTPGNSARFFGSVTQVDGADSGSLNMQTPTGSPVNYQSASGQSSQMSLTVSSAGGGLTYSIAGAPSASVSNMTCASQSYPSIPEDGSAGAPTGPPQRPEMLSGYVVRPVWKVAGVDYAVGYPAGQVLKDPLTDPALAANPNVLIDQTNRIIRVTGSGVTLDGYDFTLNGGYSVSVITGNNTVVRNSRVGYIVSATGTSNLTVTNCVMDGGGATNGWALIRHSGTGVLTVEYNWLRNFPQHAIESLGSGSIVYKYNLIENGGMRAGAELSYLQLAGGPFNSVVIEFNSTYQPEEAGFGSGFDLYNVYGSGAISGTIAYNTMIAAPTAGGRAMRYLIRAGGYGGGQYPEYPGPVSASIHNNYLDFRGAAGPFHVGMNNDGRTSASYSNNFDMTTGSPLTTDP